MNGWILCSERLPEDNKAVLVTWINRNPESYYSSIKDKPLVGAAHYMKRNNKWYWHSVVCEDILNEYGYCEIDRINKDIEITAWMPLPKPYSGKL